MIESYKFISLEILSFQSLVFTFLCAVFTVIIIYTSNAVLRRTPSKEGGVPSVGPSCSSVIFYVNPV